jgi:lysozyme family protein
MSAPSFHTGQARDRHFVVDASELPTEVLPGLPPTYHTDLGGFNEEARAILAPEQAREAAQQSFLHEPDVIDALIDPNTNPLVKVSIGEQAFRQDEGFQLFSQRHHGYNPTQGYSYGEKKKLIEAAEEYADTYRKIKDMRADPAFDAFYVTHVAERVVGADLKAQLRATLFALDQHNELEARSRELLKGELGSIIQRQPESLQRLNELPADVRLATLRQLKQDYEAEKEKAQLRAQAEERAKQEVAQLTNDPTFVSFLSDRKGIDITSLGKRLSSTQLLAELQRYQGREFEKYARKQAKQSERADSRDTQRFSLTAENDGKWASVKVKVSAPMPGHAARQAKKGAAAAKQTIHDNADDISRVAAAGAAAVVLTTAGVSDRSGHVTPKDIAAATQHAHKQQAETHTPATAPNTPPPQPAPAPSPAPEVPAPAQIPEQPVLTPAEKAALTLHVDPHAHLRGHKKAQLIDSGKQYATKRAEELASAARAGATIHEHGGHKKTVHTIKALVTYAIARDVHNRSLTPAEVTKEAEVGASAIAAAKSRAYARSTQDHLPHGERVNTVAAQLRHSLLKPGTEGLDRTQRLVVSRTLARMAIAGAHAAVAPPEAASAAAPAPSPTPAPEAVAPQPSPVAPAPEAAPAPASPEAAAPVTPPTNVAPETTPPPAAVIPVAPPEAAPAPKTAPAEQASAPHSESQERDIAQHIKADLDALVAKAEDLAPMLEAGEEGNPEYTLGQYIAATSIMESGEPADPNITNRFGCHGYLQYCPDFWPQRAQHYLGDANASWTVDNQTIVAVKEWNELLNRFGSGDAGMASWIQGSDDGAIIAGTDKAAYDAAMQKQDGNGTTIDRYMKVIESHVRTVDIDKQLSFLDEVRARNPNAVDWSLLDKKFPLYSQLRYDQIKAERLSNHVTDLGMHDTYVNGEYKKQRLFAIKGFRSTSEESTPGSRFYVEGADGNVIVNEEIVDKVVALFEAAKKDGITLTAASSFRTDEHQQELWGRNPNPTEVARPHQSNHEGASAIDFDLDGLLLDAGLYRTAKGGLPGSTNPRVAPQSATWRWLRTEAPKYGLGQYYNEPWHWSPSGH